MDITAIIKNLNKYQIFAYFEAEQVREFIQSLPCRKFDTNSLLMREGELERECFLILKGKVHIQKYDIEYGEFTIASLEVGDLVGEVALFDNKPRSATAKCVEPCEVVVITEAALNTLIDKDKRFSGILVNIAKRICNNLRSTNETTINALKDKIHAYKSQAEMGRLLVIIVFLLSFFSFFNITANKLMEHLASSSYVTIPLMIVLIIFLIIIYKIFRIPASQYGLTLKNWRRSLRGAIVYSIPILIVTVMLKWCLVHFSSAYASSELFSWNKTFVNGHYSHPWSAWLFNMMIYCMLICPFQELLARSGLQVPLQKILTGRYKVAMAIVASNTIFMTAHVFMSPFIALLVFLPGIYFGWLFHHYKTLVAPMVAHALIGGWGLGVVGF